MSSGKGDPLLPVLYADIDRRCRHLAESLPPWPCHRGCDHCCRSLAEPPHLVAAEWRQLEAGLASLPEPVRRETETRIDALVGGETHRGSESSGAGAAARTGSITCPFLDLDAGACRVYEHRPAACRTYGFYQARDGGLHCDLVGEHVADLDGNAEAAESPWHTNLVWGSQEAVDRRLRRALGATIPMARWWAEYRRPQPKARLTRQP